MIKSFLKKFLPARHHIINYKSLRIFGSLIHNPNLWHLTRHSVSRACSVGLLCAWAPVPFQMVLAAIGAMLFHANLPLSVCLVWITNPFTMPPLFLFAYYVGTLILDLPQKPFNFEISLEWFMQTMQSIGQPFLLGCLVCGIISAILGNIAMRVIWRFFIIRSWKARQARMRAKMQAKQNTFT